MRILETFNIDEWRLEIHCRCCLAKLESCADDYMPSATFFITKCAACGSSIWIDPTLMPDPVSNRIRNKK